MDKKWICSDRLSIEYRLGVDEFLEFAIINSENRMLIRCPCTHCCNMEFHTPKEVKLHLFQKGFLQTYIVWSWHGESISISPSANCQDLPQSQQFRCHDYSDVVDMVQDAYEQCDKDHSSFTDMLEDAEKPLYPCSKHSKLSGLMRLYNVKGNYGWSDKGFSALLEVLADILPKINNLPKSMYEAKKTMKVLGLDYDKIHACPNDCILYRNEFANLIECPICGESRWKIKNDGSKQLRKGVPGKVLWYFPIIPRFKRMFHSTQTAENLTWHANKRIEDGKLRHPADSPAWKLIDNKWPDFSQDPRNLRLALSSDGVNPYSTQSTIYSCWPVTLITYNLPPWLCMKRKFMMLSLLISGPKQPGNDIDVYLQPLIEDLKTLWDVGVAAYDAYKKETFNLRAVLMWTISDFPAYGNLFGCTVKGYYACPLCGISTCAHWLPHSRKMSYMGHQRFLPPSHSFQKLKKAFIGKPEWDCPPKTLSGEEIFKMVDHIKTKFGKRKIKKRKSDDVDGEGEGEGDEVMVRKLYKKKSIFFELEYWKHLLVRHLLDVMHIEKNVCENIYGTILHQTGKTKDGINARKDLDHLKVREKLVPDKNSNVLPPAPYTLSKKEKKMFCETLQHIKVPNGYSSNFRNLISVDDYRLQGLKSHDCHTLMQQLLPLAIRNCLPKNIRNAIIRLCFFFNSLCTMVIKPDTLQLLQKELVITLCLLEQYFLPSFFDIMIHLTVHLVEQVRLCGPVFLLWMYPFERDMKRLKGYVRNRSHPEGCIAESYIAKEALEFCT